MSVSPNYWTQQPDLVARCTAMMSRGVGAAEVAAAVGAPSAKVLRNHLSYLRKNGAKIPFFPRYSPLEAGEKPLVLDETPVPKVVLKFRPCLKCRRHFKPSHGGNFICPSCAATNRKNSTSFEGVY